MKPLHKQRPSSGLALARNRIAAMSDEDIAATTSERLIASYGLTLSEADHLIRSLRRV